MARPPTLTDDEILLRARAVFVERGYGARTPEIAAAVGLSWGALVFRFGGKAELFRRAMAESIRGSCAVDWLGAGGSDLRGLLEQLRSHLWEQWPIHLQYRLAKKTSTQNEKSDRGFEQLGEWLSLTLEAQAARGAVRTDMPASTLARIILSLLVGDVAKRFLGGERTFAADAALLDCMMRLMTSRGTERAGRSGEMETPSPSGRGVRVSAERVTLLPPGEG